MLWMNAWLIYGMWYHILAILWSIYAMHHEILIVSHVHFTSLVTHNSDLLRGWIQKFWKEWDTNQKNHPKILKEGEGGTIQNFFYNKSEINKNSQRGGAPAPQTLTLNLPLSECCVAYIGHIYDRVTSYPLGLRLP